MAVGMGLSMTRQFNRRVMVYSVWEEYELSEEKIEKMEVLTE